MDHHSRFDLKENSTDGIRERFLRFFEARGHTICPSDSLVPQADPTLLFTGAGMNQFKDMFIATGPLKFTRAATSQKCLRTGDLEKVGRTAKHHTFFEMLGNFSFGDYFKEEAISWAYEFLIKELRLPLERLSVTIHEEDDEAFKVWTEKVGFPVDRIFRFGDSDNFWPANAIIEGPNGPCGPCSEIFYDRGSEYSCGAPDCGVGCDCDRFVEIWNLVFTQYDRQEGGILAPLPKKNIDTGMGLERIASVVQGVPTNFEIDIFVPIIREIASILNIEYIRHTEEGSRTRRIADHIRALCFLISDGVLPSNEGRGYVERRILRRAVRDGMTLGAKQPFLYTLVPVVADVMVVPYPEIKNRRENIARIIKAEEEKFLDTVEQGSAILNRVVADLKARGEKWLSGKEAFQLYDTYGFPLDLTEYFLHEHGIHVDKAGYEREMEIQKMRARAASAIAGEIFAGGPLSNLAKLATLTQFTGYEEFESQAKVQAIIKGDTFVESVSEGEVIIVTDRSPFYAEAGGQVGDTGIIKNQTAQVEITNTTKHEDFWLHHGKVTKGELRVGVVVTASVDEARRRAIMRSHTATHILQFALRTVLGQHVEQAGSLVTADRLRFDYNHFETPSREELRRVQEIVNLKIMQNSEVSYRQSTYKEAKKEGVLAFFGEKYGEKVRIVSIGDYSKELCGGTHCVRTGDIGFFRILRESSIAAGVRRIEAVTGIGALRAVEEADDLLIELSSVLSAPPENLVHKVNMIKDEVRQQKKVIAKLRAGSVREISADIVARAETIGDIKFVAHRVEDMEMEELRTLSDSIKGKLKSGVILLATGSENKVNMVLSITKDLVAKGLDASKMIKEIAMHIQGGGGGRPDMAQAGGKNPEGIDASFKKAAEMISAFHSGGKSEENS